MFPLNKARVRQLLVAHLCRSCIFLTVLLGVLFGVKAIVGPMLGGE